MTFENFVEQLRRIASTSEELLKAIAKAAVDSCLTMEEVETCLTPKIGGTITESSNWYTGMAFLLAWHS